MLIAAYGVTAPALAGTLTVSYRRSTLVDLERGDRLAMDVDLACRSARVQARGLDRVLVESKSAEAGAEAETALARMGVRPLSVSKYCVAVALLHPDLPANPWHRTLIREFAWAPRRGGPPGPTTNPWKETSR